MIQVDFTNYFAEMKNKVEEFSKRNPLVAVVISFVVGFLVGILI